MNVFTDAQLPRRLARRQLGGIIVPTEDTRSTVSSYSVDCFAGKPCIRGHRIWVSRILDMLAEGVSVSEILDNYPGLTEEDIRACIAYGSEMSRERYVDITTGA